MNVIRGNNFTKCHVISKIGRTNCYRCIFLDVNFIFSFIDILVILKTTKKLYIKKQGSYLHLSNTIDMGLSINIRIQLPWHSNVICLSTLNSSSSSESSLYFHSLLFLHSSGHLERQLVRICPRVCF